MIAAGRTVSGSDIVMGGATGSHEKRNTDPFVVAEGVLPIFGGAQYGSGGVETHSQGP